MNLIRHLLNRLRREWSLSIRRQLAWSFSLASLVILLVAGYFLFSYQRHFQYAQGNQSAQELAQALAFSSTSWVLANDLAGLQEILRGAADVTDIRFAVVLSPQGEVLASTRPEYLDRYFSDEVSRRLLVLPGRPQILQDQRNLIDVAAPVVTEKRLIGWVRVVLSREAANANLRRVAAAGFAIASFLALMITLIAFRLARRLTCGLERLSDVANDAEHGRAFVRVDIERPDEVGILARHLYKMLDAKEAEEKARIASEARFRRLVQDVPIPLAYVNKEGSIQYFNTRFAQIFGYTHEDIPSVENWFRLAYPDETYRQWVVTTWNAAVQTAAESGGDIHPVEYKVTCKSGEIRTMEISGVVMGEELLASFIDLTERKHNEEELNRYKDHLEEQVHQRTADLELARDEAEAANRAKSVFLSSMSHELRTPLNAILGFSGMMRCDAQLSDEQRENLDIINRSGEHLLTLINDVLEMAKIEAGRVQIEREPVDLGALVRDVTDMMHMRSQEKGLQLLIDQSSDFPRYIKGDEARLRQILINLVGNAVKFTLHGGIILRFGMRPDTMPERLLIEVEDSGIGISELDQRRIFEPFVQVGELSSQKGTGLGLTITRQFVKLMGGDISVESSPGKGSIFRVELPVEKVEPGAVAMDKKAETGDVTGLAAGMPEYRILVVEDQLENQLLLAKLLKNAGFQVRVAENGQLGVELFQSWHPHLILMDRRMPVMDGLEATRRIRELPGGKEVKIVAVTASAFMEQRTEMLDAGMDEFVRKPYRFNEIYECLGRQLGVQYTYAGPTAEEDAAEVVLTDKMLAVLQPSLRAELRRALESLDEVRIDAAIGQISDTKLRKTLAHLAANFDYPSILKALA
ncbi:MAG: ATP-binding protein [Gallionella sp.]|nr:ATP-binding protein [Gallionella sp.]